MRSWGFPPPGLFFSFFFWFLALFFRILAHFFRGVLLFFLKLRSMIYSNSKLLARKQVVTSYQEGYIIFVDLLTRLVAE